jgi:hypothetical protein
LVWGVCYGDMIFVLGLVPAHRSGFVCLGISVLVFFLHCGNFRVTISEGEAKVS